ncbi:hypothetical protein [Arthrobacter mobilis]|uniref:Uncharacterized protein n=1 Tax=Arthrobacter mobilis TaxID=2724944 RepID=A0A7X6K7P4_9MICC|nr:hypothetical protein [Arthrobacter mobilis]NKX56708.1 hypothetical protein [Arthrobacter mobilis]
MDSSTEPGGTPRVHQDAPAEGSATGGQPEDKGTHPQAPAEGSEAPGEGSSAVDQTAARGRPLGGQEPDPVVRPQGQTAGKPGEAPPADTDEIPPGGA